MQDNRYVFVGPTADRGAYDLAGLHGFRKLPPARRGDIAALLDKQPGVAVLVDGVFGHALSVGHAEIRSVLSAGWEVFGLGSLGAIRAFELRELGMHGYGVVYGHFLAEPDFQDDEVALLHAPVEPYQSISEPLVHLRHLVQSLEDGRYLTSECAAAIIGTLKMSWFGDRTLPRFLRLVATRAGPRAREAAEQRSRATFFRVKQNDLRHFFLETAWEDPRPPMPVPLPYG